MWPFMTSEVILNLMKSLSLYNISIHFINECAGKEKAKFLELRSFLWVIEKLTFYNRETIRGIMISRLAKSLNLSWLTEVLKARKGLII